MPKPMLNLQRRRLLLSGLLGTGYISLPTLMAGCNKIQGQGMQEIKFDLGKDIVETAKNSGVPKFSARDIEGYITYSVNGIPREIPAHYTRPGYEITWGPIFSFRMNGSKNGSPPMAVHSVDLQLDAALNTHAAAQAFFEQTVAQFKRGKWQRYADPKRDIILSGRSSYLSEQGALTIDGIDATGSLDPYYKIPAEDWPRITENTGIWYWFGDGILATLELKNNTRNNVIAYTGGLTFENLAYRNKVRGENLAKDLVRNDEKGWDSPAKRAEALKLRQERNKRLGELALKRGDQLLPFSEEILKIGSYTQ